MACLVSACLPFPKPSSALLVKQEREATRRLVATSFPQLLDLVDNGTLLVLERSPNYGERRDDGYQQPLLVFLIGTSHMSARSAQHVRRVVTTVRPENVVVELCRSRAGIMTEMPEHNANSKSNPNLLSMTGESFGAALSRSLKIGGQSAMSLRLLLALVSESLSSIAGVRSGEEFRAAYKAAIEVGAQIVLGDRPIEITLRRSWEALDWPSKWRFTAFLLRGIGSSNLDLSEDSLQALRSDDALSAIFSYLSKEFPALLQPLIHERDKYLAWSLTRSQAVNGSSRVVGVVGMGHVEGIVYALKYESDKLRFRELAGVSESQDARESSRQFLIRLVVETIVGFLLWIAFNQWYSDGDTHVFTSLFQSSRI